MKTYIDRLREAPLEKLEAMIRKQEAQVVLSQRDLEIMRLVLKERASGRPSENVIGSD